MENSISQCELRAVASTRESGGFGKSQDPSVRIALLTAGRDRHYALGLASALLSQNVGIDLIGSDELNAPELHNNPRFCFLNLRGSTRSDVRVINKVARVIAYYLRLICYAAAADPKVFHILWNNRFELFDRTVLTLYYRLLGKRLVLTAHNVNAGKRDGNDCWLNRFSLATQYRLVHHIFVHTDKMKRELALEFKVPGAKATVIPYGINNKVPDTALTSWEAKERLGLKRSDKALLFFGGITPYKGLEYAVRAVAELATSRKDYRLIIAGRPRDDMAYWKSIEKEIAINRLNGQVIVRSEFIPDEDIEVYFKAADVLILPYTYIFQSGVLFLGYSFGLPVIAADVGSLREEIIEGQTGFLFDAENADDLADVIQSYFQSDLFNELDERRQWIRQYANDRYSWAKVAVATKTIYSELVED